MRIPFRLHGVPWILLAAGLATQAFGASGGRELTFCHFGPKLKVLEPVVKDSAAGPCEGSAKIQAVLWECDKPEGVMEAVPRLRKRLAEEAAEECSKHCANRAPGCKAKFDVPSHCGLETDREESIAAGKKFGCGPDCSGSAFAYCSLYNAGYHTDEATLVGKQAPNCHCTP